MNKKLKKVFGLMDLVLALTACGSGSNEKESAKTDIPKQPTMSEQEVKPEERSKDEFVLALVLNWKKDSTQFLNHHIPNQISSTQVF